MSSSIALRLASAAARVSTRAASTNAAGCVAGPNGKFTVTIFPGDGIGPEISNAVQEIFEVRRGVL